MAVIKRIQDVPGKDLSDGGEVVGVVKQVVLGPADGAPTFAVRLFTVSPGGHTPKHAHPFEHGVIVLEGEGELWTDGGGHNLSPGTAVLVRPNELHQFRNTGNGPLKFLCIVPKQVEG
ncbi:MAG: Cupin 2 conserved barrel domain protein [Acetothermia bacterium 64_32]|nr:MAG: Cupin 2 conserved barrel domain protein [Acetothermia bacterium 64_32]HAF71008.1 cupin domain-containing protein [Candidatus Acetothermia bacterium]